MYAELFQNIYDPTYRPYNEPLINMDEDHNSQNQTALQNEVFTMNEKQISLENKLEQILGIVTNFSDNNSA